MGGRNQNKTGVGTEPYKDTENFFPEVACGMPARRDIVRSELEVVSRTSQGGGR